MKTIIKPLSLCLTVLFLASCATPEMTPEQQQVRPISETNDCKFIKTAYFEVAHPSKVHYYAAKNVVIAGGDSYEIMATGKDRAAQQNIHTTTIGIYKCN
ncbi:MAG: hypothetical protein L3J22_05645 [Xanthomonadales bacterium]|nr:hypothetical protein [Xanthomonadales bacterium]